MIAVGKMKAFVKGWAIVPALLTVDLLIFYYLANTQRDEAWNLSRYHIVLSHNTGGEGWIADDSHAHPSHADLRGCLQCELGGLVGMLRDCGSG